MRHDPNSKAVEDTIRHAPAGGGTQESDSRICQRAVDEYSFLPPRRDPAGFVKRPVRNRMRSVVVAGGLKPPATG